MASISEGQVFTFTYKGNYETWYPDKDCEAVIMCYGAQGGSLKGVGGNGGKSSGLITLKKNIPLYIYVGGKPTDGNGGFNGGGDSSHLNRGSGGGGATDVRIGGKTLNHRIIVAGGGGGGADDYTGGSGGGTEGLRGGSMGNNGQYSGNGGTQTAGGKPYNGETIGYGTFGNGGTGQSKDPNSTSNPDVIGGGGGGWYGGSGGYYAYASGAGGSGYVLTETSYKPEGYVHTDGTYNFSQASTTTSTNVGNGRVTITIASIISINKIEIASQPKTSYFVGENFVQQGTIKVNYSSGTSKIVPITLNMLTGFNTSTVGTKTVTITYEGFTTTYIINVVEPVVIKSIEIFTSPKKSYKIGESFVEQGMIQATYSDNSQLLIPITSDLLTGFDTSIVGTKTVTIIYEGVTTTYDITVIGVTNMIFTEQPVLEYMKNDVFIQKGLISVTWSDTNIESIPLTSDMVTGFDTSTVGTKTLTVTYYNGSLTYDIEVSNIVSVDIDKQPITEYKLFDSFKDGGTLKVTYEGGAVKYVNITSDIVQNFNTDTVGYNLVTLNYAGFRVSYMILVMVDEISCVFDRTLEDVTYAFNNQTSVSKGALNYEDLNRIEGNIDILVLALSTIGYYLRLDVKTNWEETDIPTYVEMNRIRNNIRKLIIKFVEIGIFPQVEDLYYLDYTEVNNWERILCQLFMGYKNYLETIIYCGTRYCGE